MSEEQLLRKHIRTAIDKRYANQLQEESSLRNYIRQIISEAKIEDSPTKSTGINKLISVLKVILPTVEKSYKSLTSDPAQRESFIKHYIHAVINTLSPQDAMESAFDEAEPTMAEGLLKEQEADPDKFIDIGIRTEKEQEDEELAAAAEKEIEDKVSKEDAATTKN